MRNTLDKILILVISGASALAAILALSYSYETPLDYLRWAVLAQAFVVISLYAVTLGNVVYRIWSDWKGPALARQLRLANAARLLACLIIVCEATSDVSERLGNQILNFRTPVLQVALILLALAWGFMDRFNYQIERRSSPGEMQKIIDSLSPKKS